MELRNAKLPNETGGVLVGSLDLERKIAYVIDTVPSPPDSEEWPTVYIRGCRGLRRQVDLMLVSQIMLNLTVAGKAPGLL